MVGEWKKMNSIKRSSMQGQGVIFPRPMFIISKNREFPFFFFHLTPKLNIVNTTGFAQLTGSSATVKPAAGNLWWIPFPRELRLARDSNHGMEFQWGVYICSVLLWVSQFTRNTNLAVILNMCRDFFVFGVLLHRQNHKYRYAVKPRKIGMEQIDVIYIFLEDLRETIRQNVFKSSMQNLYRIPYNIKKLDAPSIMLETSCVNVYHKD